MKTKRQHRIALSLYFFLTGVCFSSWASRIPTIKSSFHLNEAELGNLLLVMPIGSIIGLPISGWLVSKFDTRSPLLVAFLFFTIALFTIGFTNNLAVLVIAICVFSFCMRIINIAMNTQSLTLQKVYKKKIIGSLHGIWSTGGLVGVIISTFIVDYNIDMKVHLGAIALSTFISCGLAYNYLLRNDKATEGNKIKLGKPDAFILYLGILVFFACIAEGAMFDWSGVYFKEVIKEPVFTIGYLTFMIFMALSRFGSDKVIEKLGMKSTYLLSSSLIISGILIVILFPFYWPALIGFGIVGLGVAAVIPMTFSLAGTSKKYSPGMAISIIATYGIVGMLIGPPLIGYLAHAFNLKIAFILIIFCGLMLVPISRLFFSKFSKE